MEINVSANADVAVTMHPANRVAFLAPCLRHGGGMAKKIAYTVVRGGKLLDIDRRRALPADILIKGDTIAEIGRPGLAAPDGATAIDARHRLIHPA